MCCFYVDVLIYYARLVFVCCLFICLCSYSVQVSEINLLSVRKLL